MSTVASLFFKLHQVQRMSYGKDFMMNSIKLVDRYVS